MGIIAAEEEGENVIDPENQDELFG